METLRIAKEITGTLIRIKRVMSYSPEPKWTWYEGEKVTVKSVDDLKEYPSSFVKDDENDPGGWIVRPDEENVTHKDVKHIRRGSREMMYEVEGNLFLEF